MSHTIRRKRSHTPHERGGWRQNEVRNRPQPVRPQRRERAAADVSRMVSDHAVVRWMQRVVGLDLRQQFIASLLPPERAELVATMQSGRLRVHDTPVVLIVRGGVVASVIVEGECG